MWHQKRLGIFLREFLPCGNLIKKPSCSTNVLAKMSRRWSSLNICDLFFSSTSFFAIYSGCGLPSNSLLISSASEIKVDSIGSICCEMYVLRGLSALLFKLLSRYFQMCCTLRVYDDASEDFLVKFNCSF